MRSRSVLYANGTAALMDGERAVCSFPTAKRPRDTVWPLAAYSSSQASMRPESDTCR